MDFTNAPGYLQAADLHNIGAQNPSFFDDPVQAVSDDLDAVGNAAANIPNFAISSIASGINSIYNTGVAAGNFFGVTDAQKNDLQTTLASYDSNLGDYYGANKQLADVSGFIATSFVPGIGGIKLFQTGQRVLSSALEAGTVGRTLAEATGLIPTVTEAGETLTQVAARTLAEGQQTFSFLNAGVIKAISSGFAQNAWEGAAFEAMVQATMQQSPILEGQDYKDIASNILMGGLTGGAIGGLVHTASVYGEIKGAITSIDGLEKPFTVRASQAYLDDSPASRIITNNFDMAATPEATTQREIALTQQRIQNINNENRSAWNQLAGKDSELGNVIADNMQGVDGDIVSKSVAGATKIERPGVITAPGEGETVGHIKLYGEDAGTVTYDPLHDGDLTLADKIVGGSDAIDNAVAQIAGKWKSGQIWSPVTATSMDEVEARYIWAQNTAKYADGMTIGAHDIPLQEGALKRGLNVKIDGMDGQAPYEVNAANLPNEVVQNKRALVNELGQAKGSLWGFRASGDAATDIKGMVAPKAGEQSSEGWRSARAESQQVQTITSNQIARAANVSVKAIENQAPDVESGVSMFARQDAQAAYDAMRQSKGITRGEGNLNYIPQHARVTYQTEHLANSDWNTVQAYTAVQTRQAIAQDAVDRAFAGIAGKYEENFVHPGSQFANNTNRYGAGPGVVTYANGGYGTAASWAEQTGKATGDLMQQTRKNVNNILESVALRLRADQTSAIAWDALRNQLASTTEKYILDEAGDGLIAEKTAAYRSAVQSGQKGVQVPVLQAGAPETIAFQNPLVGDAAIAHMEASGYVTEHMNNLTSASMGVKSGKSVDTFYPYKPDPKSMPYFAFVKDESVVGQGMGHTSMIHAATEKDLADMMDMVRSRTGYSVYTKSDAEDFYKAQQEYTYERTLHDNYMDSNLKSNGINNQFFPKTDPNKIVDEWLGWHQNRATVLAREAVSTKFSNEFDQLESLGSQFTNVAASRYKTSAADIENITKNPYNDYRKTALNISKLGEYPFLSAMNRGFSGAINGTLQRIFDTFDQAKSVNDLQTVNDALQAAGVNSAYKSAAEVILANHSAPPQYVGNFIRGANAILQNMHLRLDFLNPIHITAASQVLLGHEIPEALRSVMRGIGDSSVTVPGTQNSILSPMKLYANAQKGWLSRMDEGKEAFFKQQGWSQGVREQTQSIHEDLTVLGNETPSKFANMLASAKSKAQELVNIGGKITGNDYAEAYNRFISAHIADQISELGISKGLMDPDQKLSFINTFMNRTHANTLASQRPLLFQGPIGQALGLFQSYQFNVMQQLFRSISEGSSKDAAMLLGLQGTMFGLNGEPGFNFINQHIIGTNSNNPTHKDAYTTLYGAAGKTVGDWLMYGAPSNILQTNIYNRGNINPRSLSIIPTSPADVFAVADFSKAIANIGNTVSKIAGGGQVWQSILQGVEHNGLSRPLSGLAQTAQALGGNNKVFSTTNQGDISFVNDFMSLATLSRLAGGKPLDEALANDELSRTQVYKAADKARMNAATEAFKTNVIGNPNAAPADVGNGVNNYMAAFVHNGGSMQDFNKQMLNMTTRANTPRANQVIQSLKGPYPEHMKMMMGGSVEDLLGMNQEQ